MKSLLIPHINFTWTEWHPLDVADKENLAPDHSTIYRVSHSQTSGLEYVGHGELNNRIYRLNLGLQKERMPYKDPHMAAPNLWALQEENKGKYWVSWVDRSFSNEEEIIGKKAAFIAQYRSAVGRSPTANFGHMIEGYSSSTYSSGNVRGQKMDEEVSGEIVSSSPRPWNDWDKIESQNWMGYEWTNFQPLFPDLSEVSNIKDDIPSSSGVIRVRNSGEPILTEIWGTPNLRERIFDIRESTTDGEFEVSYTVVDFERRRHRYEIESDLVGVHYLATEVTPFSDLFEESISESYILNLIEKGEGPRIEFKKEVPKNGMKLTKDMLGLANNEGGYILIGVSNNGEIEGVDSLQEDKERIADLANSENIEPRLSIESQEIRVKNKDIIMIEVPKAANIPHGRSGTFYKRKGPQSEKMTGSDLEKFFSGNRS